MSGPFSNGGRLTEADKLWLFVARILAFFFGATLVGYMAFFSAAGSTEKLAFATVGVGFMWPVVGTGVIQAFAAVRGNGRRNGSKRDE